MRHLYYCAACVECQIGDLGPRARFRGGDRSVVLLPGYQPSLIPGMGSRELVVVLVVPSGMGTAVLRPPFLCCLFAWGAGGFSPGSAWSCLVRLRVYAVRSISSCSLVFLASRDRSPARAVGYTVGRVVSREAQKSLMCNSHR